MGDDTTDVIDWLLDGDPAIRWQVRRDLLDGPDDEIAAERARVAREGWGAELLSLQGDDGTWAGTEYGPNRERNSTMWTLQVLRNLGIDPADPAVVTAIDRVRAGVASADFPGLRYFDGEEEACVNGGVLANAAYFGALDVGQDRMLGLLDEGRKADGGWNCDPSERSSFDSTLCVLEGLLAWERAVTSQGEADAPPSGLPTVAEVREWRHAGEEFLLERHLFRRRSTGEIVKDRYLNFTFPTYWFYDVLRALDYFRDAGAEPDARLAEPLDLLAGGRRDDGTWAAGRPWPGVDAYELDAPEGEPSRWNTLRALRVLHWAGGADAAQLSDGR
ncbi:hypothetical protein ACGGZK_19180 [Agromyces sp. MMS24-K17]|uniref:hypothetical protein n=1 Tax=Agromyces sp. MMS24-K17 TaxID=3372850 RepID=UPI003754E07D